MQSSSDAYTTTMNGVVTILTLFATILACSEAVNGLICYTCEGGPLTNCAKVLGIGKNTNCVGRNAQCYEALVKYQNGALTLVERRCWATPNGSNATDFCNSFNNPVGKLGKCITCRTDLCNTDQNFWL